MKFFINFNSYRLYLVTILVSIWFIFQPAGARAQSPTKGAVSIKGEVFNASTAKSVSGVKIQLFKMGAGLEEVQTLETAGPNFQFAPILPPDGALLIAVDYNGETYFRMLHSADTNFTLPQRIFVFDDGAPAGMVRLTSMVRVEKTNKGLLIEKMFLVMNGSAPARNLNTEHIRFRLPEGAKDVEAYLRLETTNLSLPVNVSNDSTDAALYKIDRDFRPGNATLTFRYRIEDDRFVEKMPDVIAITGEPPVSHNFHVLGWKPDDAIPEIKGAASEEMKNVPGMGKALKLSYDQSASVEYDFHRGSVITENLLEAHFNPIFSSTGLSIIGLLLFTGAILVLAPYGASYLKVDR